MEGAEKGMSYQLYSSFNKPTDVLVVFVFVGNTWLIRVTWLTLVDSVKFPRFLALELIGLATSVHFINPLVTLSRKCALILKTLTLYR